MRGGITHVVNSPTLLEAAVSPTTGGAAAADIPQLDRLSERTTFPSCERFARPKLSVRGDHSKV